MIQEQMLEAIYVIRIGDNPVATRAWNVAVMALVVRFPEQILRFSGPVIFENEVAPHRQTPAGRRVLAKIQYVIVILPRMVAWIAIQIADICTVGRHGE